MVCEDVMNIRPLSLPPPQPRPPASGKKWSDQDSRAGCMWKVGGHMLSHVNRIIPGLDSWPLKSQDLDDLRDHPPSPTTHVSSTPQTVISVGVDKRTAPRWLLIMVIAQMLL